MSTMIFDNVLEHLRANADENEAVHFEGEKLTHYALLKLTSIIGDALIRIGGEPGLASFRVQVCEDDHMAVEVIALDPRTQIMLDTLREQMRGNR